MAVHSTPDSMNMTPALRRLRTFQGETFANHSISNSPSRLVEAGFQRDQHYGIQDEVHCESCGVVYANWSGESPLAVHRVLNEDCPFLNSPSNADPALNCRPISRRQLFRDDDQFVSAMSPSAQFTGPFKPVVGGFDMLFASRRHQTFYEQGYHNNPQSAEWAEEGFIFIPQTRDVQCVFCALILPLHTCHLKDTHARNSALCPRVLLKDVGNISTEDEDRIRMKNLEWQRNRPSRLYVICYPQFEEENVRLKTFENWPPLMHIEPAELSACGFFYTGCADKVKCFSCGIGLFKWRQGSDPWEQHAHHMPTCQHLRAKGDHFIQQAAQIQVLTEVDFPAASSGSSPTESASSPGQRKSPPPGSPTLDVDALRAALSTSRYPNKEILLGTLKAADENFTTVCQQRETILQKDTVIQEKNTVIQEKDTVIQEKDTVIQEKNTVIQEKDTVIQEKDTVIQNVIQEKDTQLQNQRAELQNQRADLQAMQEELETQESLVESLRARLQVLMNERRPQQAAAIPVPAAPDAPQDEGPVTAMSCNLYMSRACNTVFHPCRHVICCRDCTSRLNNRCPVCRTHIRVVQTVFLP